MSKLYRMVHLPRKTKAARMASLSCPKCGLPFHGRGLCRRCRKADRAERGRGARAVKGGAE